MARIVESRCGPKPEDWDEKDWCKESKERRDSVVAYHRLLNRIPQLMRRDGFEHLPDYDSYFQGIQKFNFRKDGDFVGVEIGDCETILGEEACEELYPEESKGEHPDIAMMKGKIQRDIDAVAPEVKVRNILQTGEGTEAKAHITLSHPIYYKEQERYLDKIRSYMNSVYGKGNWNLDFERQ